MIIGFLLIVSGGKEEEVFWLFCCLVEQPEYGLKSIFDKHFSLVLLLIHFFHQKAKQTSEGTKIINHFQGNEIPDSLWLHKWFITIFLLDFPLGSSLRVWDNFLVDGILYLVRFIHVLMLRYKKEIFAMDLCDFAKFLKTFKDEVSESK